MFGGFTVLIKAFIFKFLIITLGRTKLRNCRTVIIAPPVWDSVHIASNIHDKLCTVTYSVRSGRRTDKSM